MWCVEVACNSLVLPVPNSIETHYCLRRIEYTLLQKIVIYSFFKFIIIITVQKYTYTSTFCSYAIIFKSSHILNTHTTSFSCYIHIQKYFTSVLSQKAEQEIIHTRHNTCIHSHGLYPIVLHTPSLTLRHSPNQRIRTYNVKEHT